MENIVNTEIPQEVYKIYYTLPNTQDIEIAIKCNKIELFKQYWSEFGIRVNTVECIQYSKRATINGNQVIEEIPGHFNLFGFKIKEVYIVENFPVIRNPKAKNGNGQVLCLGEESIDEYVQYARMQIMRQINNHIQHLERNH